MAHLEAPAGFEPAMADLQSVVYGPFLASQVAKPASCV